MIIARDAEIPVAVLGQCFEYSLVSGRVYWRQRPRELFASDATWRCMNARCAGKLIAAGDHGYVRTSLTYAGTTYRLYMHRVAWALVMGEWPAEVVDHANGDGSSNMWINLRSATDQQNKQNTGPRGHNVAGHKWAHRTPAGRFQARANVNGKTRYFGTFDTPTDATAAAARHLAPVHGEYINTGAH